MFYPSNSSFDLEHSYSIDENINNEIVGSEVNEISLEPNMKSIISSPSSLGNSHMVSSSFSNIQNAIDDAEVGDTLLLTGSYCDNNKQIRINKDKITIRGKSATNKAVLDAKGGQICIFYITGDYVRLENLIFKNANADTFEGAITATGAYLTILNCEFVNNKAQVGAIVLNNDSDYAFIKNCIFRNNGGIYTKNNNGGWGGAIDSHGSHGQIVNCTFSNNYAVNGGGAVYMKNGRNNTIRDCTFSNNEEPVGGAFALSPNYHDALLLNCRFYNNTAETNGGAIFVCNYTKVTGCIFQDNRAGNNGGAVNGHYCINIYNSTFKSNHAGNYGGGTYFQTSKNHNLTESTFIENTAKYGGAVATGPLAKVLNIKSSSFKDNRADENGGAPYLMGSAIVTSSSFNRNTVYKLGGAIFNNNQTMVQGSNFTANSADLGGAVYNGNELTLRGSIFCLNRADNGSALYNTNLSKVYGSHFKDNQAKSYVLKTQNYTVKQGQTANITVYLEYGDNYPGIYTKEKLYIDDLIPKLSSGAPNEKIVLKINNKDYLRKTNKSGFAVFKIPTNTLNPGNHKFILSHNSTKIATSINETATLKITKNKIKSKKNKKYKSKTKKSTKKTRKIAKKKIP